MADPLTTILTGDLITGLTSVYTNLIGTQLFYGIIIGLGMVILYMKTKNLGVVSIVMMLIGGTVLSLLPPETHVLAYLLLVFGIAGILYTAIRG